LQENEKKTYGFLTKWSNENFDMLTKK